MVVVTGIPVASANFRNSSLALPLMMPPPTYNTGRSDFSISPMISFNSRSLACKFGVYPRTATLVGKTGWTHAQVNGELNRLAGLSKVNEATVSQLEIRLVHDERWFARR